MSTCYKCGRDLESGVECEDGCTQVKEVQMNPAVARAILREIELHRQSRAIDFEKLQTVEDLREFLSLWCADLAIHPHHPSFEKLRKFFRETP